MTTTTLSRPQQQGATRRPFRTDIQALRAIAIGLVVINHLWPTRLGGGYVGVDVFFVISGFLITSHLTAELAQTGRLRLGPFYARRVRRLLPAALVVLLGALALVVIALPYPRWSRNAWEVISSALYVENWYLATQSVNYSALNDAASAVQHYWSLSVEEQFYLIWPVLLLAAFVLGGRRSSYRSRRSLVAAVGAVGVLSFSASVFYTATAPAQAYFVTFTRAWEFAAGALVALVPVTVRMNAVVANALGLGGFTAIFAAALSFGSVTPFPGVAALLPVLGTVAVILGGSTDARQLHDFVTRRGPVQWLGDVSYSLYLWHWPLIVVTPFLLATELTFASRAGLLFLALLLAWATRRWVEVPALRWKWWTGSTRRTFSLTAAGMAAVLLAAAAVLLVHSVRTAADQPPQRSSRWRVSAPPRWSRRRTARAPSPPSARR
ncbi:acyltransferase family protein [Microbacterium neungamense]|uniref:acyltransferase family protein n=1 Tax=Microbacterium neungamense TaxID=2810535 RepID=UPI00217CE46A|nr:acyltransferase [Microbacterium neungamense]UWF78186.1 acyltransferase [Microbacterium neungamense]